MAYWTPTYALTTSWDDLPYGALVRVIREEYVPEETKAKFGRRFSHWESATDYTWCYTGKGFLMIPWRILKEA